MISYVSLTIRDLCVLPRVGIGWLRHGSSSSASSSGSNIPDKQYPFAVPLAMRDGFGLKHDTLPKMKGPGVGP